MTDRYSDFEELRPTGEASDVPDETLSECNDGEPDRQRVATATTGYPDTPAETDTECRSCGALIPADQTKCLFCLTNHLGNSSSETDASALEWTFLGVVHMLVESSTFYGAVAKGGAAATLLASSAMESTVDDCMLIYDLEATDPHEKDHQELRVIRELEVAPERAERAEPRTDVANRREAGAERLERRQRVADAAGIERDEQRRDGEDDEIHEGEAEDAADRVLVDDVTAEPDRPIVVEAIEEYVGDILAETVGIALNVREKGVQIDQHSRFQVLQRGYIVAFECINK